MSIIKQANDWRDKFTDLSQGWGESWRVNYDEFTRSGKDEYDGTIRVGDYGEEGNYPIPDEEFAKLIVLMFNDSWEIIDGLLDEIERVQLEADDRLAVERREVDRLRKLFKVT